MKKDLIQDKSVKILLDRREEIRLEINKLQAESSAIEDLIMRDYRTKQKNKEER